MRNEPAERNEIRAPRPLPREARDAWGPFLRTMLWIGLNSFGGPIAQIGLMHQVAVEKRKWLSEAQFTHLLGFANVLPGPEALELAIHLGYLRRGVPGGIAAGLLFLWPGFLSLALLGWMYVTYGHLALISNALDGVRPVAIALVAAAAVRLSRQSLTGLWSHVLMAAAFLASLAMNAPFLIVLVGCGLAGLALGTRLRDEPPLGRRSRHAFVAGLIVAAAVLVMHPWSAEQSASASAATSRSAGTQSRENISTERLAEIAWINTRAALVTFGGAYTVLPYLREQFVEQRNWLTDAELADGLALGETTPGPLVSVAVFFSYLAGGLAGALVGGACIFLPSFLLVLSLGRHIEKLENLPYALDLLRGFAAATLGLIIALASQLISYTPQNTFSIALTLAAFVAIWRFRVGAAVVVICGALSGMAYAALTT